VHTLVALRNVGGNSGLPRSRSAGDSNRVHPPS
jgi:hypothetical protein